MLVTHTIDPIYFKDSKILILGSIPSVKSREEGFYYAHPQNRFWKTLEAIFDEKIGESKEDKILFLKNHKIALFDVIKSCEIDSSSDSTIKNPIPNDILSIINKTKIKTIFTTGKKAYNLYQKYCYPDTKINAIYLPSTSPANCPKGIEAKLKEEYSKILIALNN